MQRGKFLIKGREGEVSETMTWVFATIIIFILIFLFLFAASALTKTKIAITEEEDSGVETQEMLFAILEKKVNDKTIKDMLIVGEGNARGEVEKILNDFATFNVNCDFYVSGEKGFSISLGGKGREVKMDMGKEVLLRC